MRYSTPPWAQYRILNYRSGIAGLAATSAIGVGFRAREQGTHTSRRTMMLEEAVAFTRGGARDVARGSGTRMRSWKQNRLE